MLKSKKLTIFLAFLVVSYLILSFSQVQAYDRISWNGRLSQGKDIHYWVDSAVTYNTNISDAVRKLRFPSGLWNPNILTPTTNKPSSKMDFYQYYDSTSNKYAYTGLYKPKTNGVENIAYLGELDYIEWLYGKIYINDFLIGPCDADLKSTILLHEMCHVYGGRDVDDRTNTIMYGYTPQVRGMTSDFNDILVQKYNY